VTSRPRASLGRVLDDLGATLLEPVCGPGEPGRVIGGVVIRDPLDEPVYPDGALVLGVGVADGPDLPDLVADLGRRGAAGLIVRAPVVASAELRSVSDDASCAVLALARGATWAQLVALLGSLLADDGVAAADDESLGGLPSGDLFAVAGAVAALLDAPVTIEDRSSRVLAFSARQDEADASRVETIIGRQVPERYARLLTERGVFRDLYRYDRPVVVDPEPIGYPDLQVPRVAFAVRAGDEVLGSIWAATHRPPTPAWEESLRDAAKLVALHLLRLRAGADVGRRLRTDLVSTALEGGVGAPEALSRLGLADRALVVMAADLRDFGARGEVEEQALAGERQRLTDAFAVHLSATSPGAAVAEIGGIVYALFPVPRADRAGEERAARTATAFLDRVGSRVEAVVAIGRPAEDLGGLASSRQTAERVLRVLRTDRKAGPVAGIAGVQAESLLLELGDLVAARGDAPLGAVAALSAYDAAAGTALVATLRAWLDNFGDVVAAAGSLFIHPNTLRYRLRRIGEISGLDLGDPEARFAAMLDLRIRPGAGHG
jgi:hypothetical protein